MAVQGNQVKGMQIGVKKSISPVIALAKSPVMLARFQEVLKDKAPQFLASVVSAVNTNEALLTAESTSVMACAMQAATLNLDVIPGLGFAALVPYSKSKKISDPQSGKESWIKVNECQFQVMTRGYVQLALRSGQYAAMNVAEIFADEFCGYNPLTGEVQLNQVAGGDRDNDRQDKVVGYAAFFKLVNGYEHTEYWTVQRCQIHGKRYSKSFDNPKGLWMTDFPSMAKKTVLKEALKKWGPLSVEMQKAILQDQKTFASMDDEGKYEDAAEDQPAIAQDKPAEDLSASKAETAKPEMKCAPQAQETARANELFSEKDPETFSDDAGSDAFNDDDFPF